ncbi:MULTISPECIES: hypothetical protein [Bacteroides]|uniref:hypothetical protein n=1 Tax=Bacteroides TaxID=816 RepID=UPI00265B6D31|nr:MULTISPECIES: hypothetical protein [Bacteroides]
MKKLISLIFISLFFSLSVYADRASSTAINLLNRQGVYVSDADIPGFLKSLAGDTISFNITAVSDVDFFTKEVPHCHQTLCWSDRPKGNRKL